MLWKFPYNLQHWFPTRVRGRAQVLYQLKKEERREEVVFTVDVAVVIEHVNHILMLL